MANLYFEATLDAEQLKRELRTTGERVKALSTTTEAEGAKMQATFNRLGAAMAGLFSIRAAKSFVSAMIEVRGEFQQLEIAIESMLGNKQQSDKLMADLIEMAAKTPFKLSELGQATKQLVAAQEPIEDVMGSLKRLGDISAGLSVPIGQLIKAYGDVRAKGKLMGQEMLQFMNAGIPMVAELAKQFNVTNAEVSELVSEGKVGFEDVKKVLAGLADEGGMFYDLMEKQSASLTGQISILGDAWAQMLNDLGEANQGVLSAGIGGLQSLVENYETIIDVIKVLVATYGAYKAIIVATWAIEKSRAIGATIKSLQLFTAGINSATRAQVAFNTAAKMNPWGLAAAGIAAIVTLLPMFNKEQEEAVDITKELTENFGKEKQSVEALFQQLKQTNAGSEKRATLLKEINSQYGTNLQNLKDEKEFLNQIEKARQGVIDKIKEEMVLKSERLRIEQNLATQQLQGGLILMTEAEVERLDKLGSIQGAEAARKRLEAQKQTLLDLQEELKQITADTASQLEGLFGGDGKGGGEVSSFDVEEYKKILSESKKHYDDYNAALRNAREEDKQGVENYYKDLTKQGQDYEAYLKNQLEEFRNNTEAKVAIYQAAASAEILIEPDRPSKIKGAKTSKLKVEPITIDDKDIAKLEAAVARYKEIHALIIAADKTAANIKLSEQLIEAAYAASEVARAISEIDADLGAAFQKMADLMGGVGNVIGVMNDENASSFQKVSGIISLAITAGGELAKIRSGWMNEEVNKQRDVNRALADQLTLEGAINDLRRERAQQEVYSSAFLDTTFADQYRLGLDKARDSQDLLNSSLGKLMGNAVFTGEGKSKRNLFGTKKGNYSFSMSQIMGDYKTLGEGSTFGDRVKLFLGNVLGGFGAADTRAQTDALKKLRNTFDDTFKSMGKTSADVAKMSSTEWVDFFSLMDEMGYITDEGTKRMVESAKKAAEEYEKAMEEMRGIISDVAGDIGKSLNDTLVKAFKSGEDAALSFQDVVNDVLQSLFMSEIITPYFRGYFDQLQSEMEQSMDGGDGSWMDDILRFSDNIGGAFDGALDMMSDFDKAMQDAGFKGFTGGGAADSSLAGAIKGVSEQTASLIAGQMNAIRINQAESLRTINDVARYSAQIAINTGFNKHLVSIDAKLDYLKSDPLKAKGL